MRNIEFYINNQLADFESLDQLPLNVSKSTDSFLELVGVGGLEIEQIFKTLSFPLTNNNCLIFEADMIGSLGVKGDTRFDYQLFIDGNKQSSGSLRLKSIVRTEGGNSRFVVEVVDSSLSLWEKLESISLNDIDLGSQLWSQSEIIDSWTDTVDDRNTIFAPIVYGVPSSTSPNAFHARDFRPSVYYIPILKAIFKKVGYTIESSFFDTEYMKAATYAYSNGTSWQRVEVIDDYQVIVQLNRIKQSDGSLLYSNVELKDIENQFDTTTQKFEPQTGAYFTFIIECKCPYNFIVNLKKNGTISNLTEVETGASFPNTKILVVEMLLELGDYIEFQLTSEFNLATGEAMEADVQIDMKTTPVLGATLKVASCLHDRPVKDFLKGVTHQMCGAWHVNEPLKKVYFEPRFGGYYNTIDGTSSPIVERFDGFYTEGTQFLDIETSSIEVEMLKPFGNSLTTGYADDGRDPIETYLKNGSSKLPYDTKITFNDRNGSDNTNRNPYFTNLYMGKVQAIISSIELPCILPSSFKVGEVLNGTIVDSQPKGEVTYEGSPKCGLIFREAVEIRVDGSSYVAPLLTQLTPFGSTIQREYSMSYSNFKKTSDGNEVRGMLSLFHLKYFAIIRQAAQLKCTATTYLTDFAKYNFRALNTVEIGHTPTNFICLNIDDFNLYQGETATYKMLAVTEPNETDVEKTVSVQIISPIVPDVT